MFMMEIFMKISLTVMVSFREKIILIIKDIGKEELKMELAKKSLWMVVFIQAIIKRVLKKDLESKNLQINQITVVIGFAIQSKDLGFI